jgi:hypothetical protein
MSFIAPNCLLPEIAADSMVFQTLRLCHGLAVHRHARFGTDWLFDDLPVDFAAAVVLIFLLTWAQPASFVKTGSDVSSKSNFLGSSVSTLTCGSDWEYPHV